MPGSDIEVIQNVRIFAVEVDGDEIRVDIYGGQDSICGTVIYAFDDEGKLAEKAGLLRQWRDDATRLTYVCRGEEAALMDELGMLSDAFDG